MNTPKRQHQRTFLVTAFFGLLAVLATTGCNQQEDQGAKNDASSEEKKQAQIEALLKENGSGPIVQPKAGSAAPAAAAPSPEGNGVAAAGDATPVQSQIVVKLVSAGTGPKQKLSYQFQVGRERNFAMNMEILSSRITNGQKEPGPPPIVLALNGTTKTVEASPTLAKRINTFADFSVTSKDIPPEMEAQMKAQFALLKGTQLIESVTTKGEVVDLQVADMAQMNPVVLGLIQNLKDGMTNQFIPLPEEEVGVGAKWLSTTTVEASGMTITQETEVELLELQGSKAKAKLTLRQSAPAQKLSDPRLPPGTTIELLKLTGGGTGNVTVDFKEMIIDSKSELSMGVDTQISGGPVPEPQKSITDTKMKIHMRLTK